MDYPFSFSSTLLEPIMASGDGPFLVLVSAPEGSGKADWINAVSQRLTVVRSCSDDTKPHADFEIIEDFDERPETQRHNLADQISTGEGRYIISTSEPAPFDLSRLQRTDRVLEIGLPDLALRLDDIRASLGNRLTDGSRRHIATLLERTGGWRFAWRIIAEEIQSGMPLSAIADTFSGAHPKISRFVEATAIRSLPEDLRLFLMKTAHFNPIGIELANHVTHRTDALALLDGASKRTGFVRRVGSAKAFSLHPIFRDVMDDIAERDAPSEIREVRASGAAWYEDRSDWLAAAHAWHAAGQSDNALRLLTENADELVTGRGEISSYRALTRTLPTTSAALLAPEIALGAVFSGDFAGAAALLEDTEDLDQPLSQIQVERRQALEIVIDFGFEKFEHVSAAAPAWLQSHAGAEPRFRSIVAASLFFSCYAENNPAGAKRALDIFRTCLKKTNSPFLQGWLAIISALERSDLGQVAAAERALEAPFASGAIRPALEVARARLAWELGDVSRAKQLISRHMETSLRHGTVEVALLGWETAINLKVLEKGLDGALSLAAEAESWMELVHGDRGQKSIRLIRTSLILKSGMRRNTMDISSEIDAISRNIELFGPGLRLKESARLLRARYAALEEDHRLAISIVQPIIREALQQSRLPVWCEASLIYAGALVRHGEHDRALRIAWNAIDRSARTGLNGTICSEGVLLAPLRDDLIRRAELVSLTDSEEAAARIAVMELAKRSGHALTLHSRAEPDIASDIEADIKLTETERQVLELAAAGASNSEIAERMMVKLSTVKWHMQNILRKLDAPSRTAAIAYARRIGLLA